MVVLIQVKCFQAVLNVLIWVIIILLDRKEVLMVSVDHDLEKYKVDGYIPSKTISPKSIRPVVFIFSCFCIVLIACSVHLSNMLSITNEAFESP